MSDGNSGLVPPKTCDLVSHEVRVNNAALDSLVAEEETRKRLLEELSSRKGMPIVVENGQRRFGPPLEYVGCPPPNGCEVFVGRLPRDCLETELVPVLEGVGPIYEMRMMITLSGRNKGYCFVTYYTPDVAERAINELNNYEIRKGWYIGVTQSLNKRILFIKDLPKHKDEAEIKFLINRLAEGVVHISVPNSVSFDQRIKNRGYCFVEFDSHRGAVAFLVRWFNKQMHIFNDDVIVEWADHVPESFGMSVTNLSPSTTEEGLFEIFSRSSNNGVVRVVKRHNRAIIYFRSQPQADMAKQSLNGKLIDGFKIRIKLNTLNPNARASRDQENELSSIEDENMDTQVARNNVHEDVSQIVHDNSNTNDVYQPELYNSGVQAVNGYNMLPTNPVVNLPYLVCNNFQPAPTFLSPGPIYQSVNAFMPVPLMVASQPVFPATYGYVPYIPTPVYMVPTPVFPEPQQLL